MPRLVLLLAGEANGARQEAVFEEGRWRISSFIPSPGAGGGLSERFYCSLTAAQVRQMVRLQEGESDAKEDAVRGH